MVHALVAPISFLLVMDAADDASAAAAELRECGFDVDVHEDTCAVPTCSCRIWCVRGFGLATPAWTDFGMDDLAERHAGFVCGWRFADPAAAMT